MPSLLTSISSMALAAAEKAGLSRGPANGDEMLSVLWQTADSPDPQGHSRVTSSLCTSVPGLQKRDYNSADPPGHL